MKTDLYIHRNEYTQSFCVLLYADARFADEEDAWLYVHKYPDLLTAEEGMRRQHERYGNTYVYKIMEFTIKATTLKRG